MQKVKQYDLGTFRKFYFEVDWSSNFTHIYTLPLNKYFYIFSDILEEKTKQLKEIAKQREPLRERLETIENEISTVSRNESHYKEKIKEYTLTLEEKTKTMEQKKEKFEKQKERAETFSKEPMETNRKAEAVFRELQVTEESIKRAEKSAEPKDVVEKKYREIRVFYNNLTEQIECLRDTVKYLDTMLR